MADDFSITGFDKIIAKFGSLPDKLGSAVKVVGPAAAYALVWELGAIHLSKPGPKTVWSTNAYGESVILTIQAPHGFVRVNKQKYIEFIKDELSKANFQGQDYSTVFKQVMDNAADRAAQLIAETAPIDTGQLRESIQAIHSGD